jgi:MFS family permease
MLSGFRGRLRAMGPAFAALLLSDAISLLAIMVGHLAVAWWIARQGGGSDLATYAGVLAVGSLISLPLLSPLGDRYCKRSLMTVSLAIMVAVASALALLAQSGCYSLPLIIAVDLVGAASGALFLPASASIVAELLPADRLTAGLGLQKSGQSLGRLLGPALGGGTLAMAGTSATLWLYAILLAIACALAWRIPRTVAKAATTKKPAWLRELRAGLAAKWHIKVERGWTALTFLVSIFFIPAVGMLLPLKIQSLGLSSTWLGLSEAALSAGMLAGALGLSARVAHRFGRFAVANSAIICVGVCLAIIGGAHRPAILMGALALVGLCIATTQLVGQTHRMLAIPPSFRARMTSVHIMVMQVAGTIGPAVAGAGLESLGVDRLYVLFGLAVLVGGIGYTVVPGYRELISMPHDAVAGYYGRTYPELFD